MINRYHVRKICFLALASLLFFMMFTGTASAQVTISSFQALPDTIDPGGTSTLSWVTANATSCTVNGSAVGVTASMPVSPATNTTYTLTCQGNGGPVSANVLVMVRFIVQGKIKTYVGGNAVANDVVVKYIKVIVMSEELAGADRELGRGYTDVNGDFSVSFTDTTVPLNIYINVEYVGEGVDGKFIEVRRDNTDRMPIIDAPIDRRNNINPGILNLGTLRVLSTCANIVSQVGDAVRFLKNNYSAWVMPQDIKVEGRTTNGASFVNGDGSYMSISPEAYNDPGGVQALSDIHHETFHWVLYRAYGNRWPNMDANCGPDPHSYNSESCEGFAMLEGAPEYFQIVSAAPDNKSTPPTATDWRGSDNKGANNSGEIVEGALAYAWYLTNDISGILKVLLTKAPDSMKEFRDEYAAERGPTSASMIKYLDMCAYNGIVYTRGKIGSQIPPESALTGSFKIINNVAFVRGKIKPQISQLSKTELRLGTNSAIAAANQKELGYKAAQEGLMRNITPIEFTFTAPVAFNSDLLWDTATIPDGEYDLIVRTRSDYGWLDDFYPDFEGDADTTVNSDEKWLKKLGTLYNQDNTPTTDDEGKVVIDNTKPVVSAPVIQKTLVP
jgi:hypothetical protein